MNFLSAAEPFCSLLTAAPELHDRVVTINGVSKSYAMTGWRLGYCGGPKEIITAMGTIQGQSTSNACSITQKAALAGITGDQHGDARFAEGKYEVENLNPVSTREHFAKDLQSYPDGTRVKLTLVK